MDISVNIGQGRFNFRTAAVLLDNERVLLHKNEYDEHWTLPGGRVLILESSEKTVVREMQEELGVKVEVNRLLWFTENFFTFEGQTFHEIGPYYLVNLVDENSLYKGQEPFLGWEGNRKLIYQWFPIDQLHKIELYPFFLREGLKRLPETAHFLTISE